MSRLSDESWVKLPLKLLKQQGISKSAAAICCCIIDQCSQSGLDAWTQISTAELAAATDTAGKTAKRAVLELEALGLIEIRRSAGSASSYRLTGCVELCPAAFKHATEQPAKPTTRARKSRAKCCESMTALSEYAQLANRFPDEDPLPGQLEFPQKGGDAA